MTRFAQAIADTNIGRAAAYLVTLLGLLGTVIGLTIQVRAMASIDLSNAQHALQFVVAVLSGLGTALYATGCGIVSFVRDHGARLQSRILYASG